MQPTKGENHGQRAVMPWLIAAIAASGALLLGIAVAEHGPGISPDSTIYLEGARSLASGSGYRYSIHPPLYSWLVSLWLHAGMSLSAAAMTVNALSYSGLVAIVGSWILREAESARLALTACMLVVLSPPMVFVSIHAWSEAPFTFLCVGTAYLLTRYLEEEDFRLLAAASVLMLLAMFARYAGVLFVATFTVLLLLAGRSHRWRRWRDAGLFAVLSVAPIGVWVANQKAGPSVLPSQFNLAETTAAVLSTIGHWVVPDFVGPGARIASGGIILLLAAILGGRGLYHLAKRSDEDARSMTGVIALMAVSVYSISLSVWASLQAIDAIGDRLLSPVYPLLVVGGIAALHPDCGWRQASIEQVRNLRADGWSTRGGMIALAFLLWLAIPAAGVWDIVAQSRSRGFGYADVTWQRSELGKFIRAWRPGGTLLSNYPAAAHWLSGQKYRRTPRIRFYNAATDSLPADLESLAADLSRGGTMHIVWFDRPMSNYLMPLEMLGERLDLELIADFSDGRIFRVSGIR